MCPSAENGNSQTNVVNGTNGSERASLHGPWRYYADDMIQITLAIRAFAPGKIHTLIRETPTSPLATFSATYHAFKSSRAHFEKENNLQMPFSTLRRKLRLQRPWTILEPTMWANGLEKCSNRLLTTVTDRAHQPSRFRTVKT
jgi:hypothetical protein